jgi:hypothetical protein
MPDASAHTCNPSSLGGRDQEDRSSKPAQANSSQNPVSKKKNHKKGLVEWLKAKALSSSVSTTKKKKDIEQRLVDLLSPQPGDNDSPRLTIQGPACPAMPDAWEGLMVWELKTHGCFQE